MSDLKFKITVDNAAALAAVRQFTQSVLTGFQSVLAPMAAAFSVAAIKEWVGSQIDAADAANKTAQKIGLSTEALTAYQYAAKLADVSNEEFTIGMKTLAQVVVDAARGQDQAVAAMQRLQLDVRNSAGELRTLDELLPGIADAFQAMPDGITKSDTAVQLFGRSGLNLIPMLNSGAEGLKLAREEAEKLGQVLGGETARQAEEFNDNLTRLKLASNGIAKILASELLPSLRDLSKMMVDNVGGVEGYRDTLKEVAGAFKTVVAASYAVGNAVLAIATVLKETGASAWALVKFQIGSVVDVFKQLTGMAVPLVNALGNVGRRLGDLAGMNAKLMSGDMTGAVEIWKRSWEGISRDLSLLKAQWESASEGTLNSVFNRFKKFGERVREGWDNVVRDWLIGIQGGAELQSALFNPTSKPSAEKPPPRSTVVDEKAATATREALEKITAEYEQAFYDQERLINLATAEQLAAFGDQVRQTKNLRAEDLANDSDYQAAKLMLEQTAARKLEQIARQTEEKIFGNAAARLQNQQAGIEGNSFLSAGQKSDQLLPILQQRLSLLQTMRGTYAAMAADASLTDEARLEAESKQLAVMGQVLGIKQQMQDMDRSAAAELQRQVAALRTESEGVTNYIAAGFGAVRSAASAFGDTVANLIDGTANWGQTFGHVSKQIISQLAQISAQFVAGKMAEMAVNTMVSQKSQAESTAASVKGAAAGLGKASEQGGWVGALIYLGVYAASLAAVTAMAAAATGGFAQGGLVTGPGTGTSDSIPARLSNGEFVMTAAATQRNRALLEMLNAGVDGMALARQRSLASPSAALAGLANPEFNVPPANPAPVNVVVIKDPHEIKAFLESHAGQQIIIHNVRNNRTQIGLDT